MIETFIILTIIGSLVSIYSISRDYQKLRLNYATYKVEKILFFLLFVLIFLLIIPYSFFESHYDSFVFIIFNYDFEITFIIELTIVIIGIILVSYFAYRIMKPKTKIRKIDAFSDTFYNLLYERKYLSVIKLIENTIDFMNKQLEGIEILRNRNLNISKPTNWDIINPPKTAKISLKAELNLFQRLKEKYVRAIISVRFKKISRKENSISFYEKLITEKTFIEHLAFFKPYLGVQILKSQLKNNVKKEFIKLYLHFLMSNNSSILYQEIFKNKDESWLGYLIREENALLSGLFKDIKISAGLWVWIPIANYVDNYIESLSEEQVEHYNSFDEGFTDYLVDDLIIDQEIFKDPIFIGIKFFDIMIKEAISQKLNDHMWLYYYDGFIKRICAVYKYPSSLKRDKEFPNKFSYLIYLIIRNLCDFLSLITKIEDYAEINDFESFRSCSAYNIAKATSATLASSIHLILSTTEIPQNFDRDQTNIILTTFFSLLKEPTNVSNFLSKILKNELLTNHYSTNDTITKLNGYLQTLEPSKFASGEYDEDERNEFAEQINQLILKMNM